LRKALSAQIIFYLNREPRENYSLFICLDPEKQNDITLREECHSSQLSYFVGIFRVLVFLSCFQRDGLVFHCRPLNGNGKNIYLCALWASSEGLPGRVKRAVKQSDSAEGRSIDAMDRHGLQEIPVNLF